MDWNSKYWVGTYLKGINMSERTQRMREQIRLDRNPISICKYRITVNTTLQNLSDPPAMLQAKILRNIAYEMPIFIGESELLVGNGAAIPHGVEVSSGNGMWDQEEIDYLKEDGYTIAPDDEIELQELNQRYKPIGSIEGINLAVSRCERLEHFVQSGLMLPPWKKETVKATSRWGGGRLQTGFGPEPGWGFFCLDYENILSKGLNQLIAECDEALASLDYCEPDAYERSINLQAMKIGMEGIIHLGKRFSKLAKELAIREKNLVRRKELEQIAEICDWVPGNSARTFREAMQMFWFLFLTSVLPTMVASLGRMDQIMYPYYKKDIAEGRITNEEVIELFECLRIKCMEQETIPGKENRRRSSGKAKWFTMTIGGVKEDGSDACNELTYLIIEALIRCPVPHHTINLRVCESTPDAVMVKALSAVAKGLTMPSFIGDKSYIEYFTSVGATLEQARNYCISGCNDGVIPGISLRITVNMVVTALMLKIWLNDGIDPRTGLRVCDPSGDLDRFQSFEEFYSAFVPAMHYMERLAGERINIENMVLRTYYPSPIPGCFMRDGIKQGKGLFDIDYVTDDIGSFSAIGMVNLAESIYNIRELVYEDKVTTLSELKKILDSNWEGNEELRNRCVNFPKYGNALEDIDQMTARLYNDWADGAAKITCGGKKYTRPSAISVTAYEPGGAITGATPDGRFDGEILADACASPTSGMDKKGYLAVLQSAMKLPQNRFTSFLFNQKFHPTALRTEEDLLKLAHTIKVYFANGGKHIQFNVVDEKIMRDAQIHPEKHAGLMVRVAGYSAYFTVLDKSIQEQLIQRTVQTSV